MNQDVVISNHHDACLDILRTALEGSANQAAYQLQQNLGGGVEIRPCLTRGRGGRPGEVGGSNPQPPRQIEHWASLSITRRSLSLQFLFLSANSHFCPSISFQDPALPLYPALSSFVSPFRTCPRILQKAPVNVF